MSRRCRNSLVGSGGTLTGGDLSSGCDCGRLAGGSGRPSAPCTEPLVYGGNILPDPGFEQQLAAQGGGPLGDEFPWWNDGIPPPLRWVSDGSAAPANGFWTIVNGGGPNRQFLSSADPNAGAFHARSATVSTTAAVSSYVLRPTTFYICALETDQKYPITARVQPGDLVSFSISAKYETNGVGSAGQLNIRQAFYFFIQGVGVYSGFPVTELQTLNTSYTRHQAVSYFVPPPQNGFPPYYYTAQYWFRKPSTGSSEVYTFGADDGQLTLIPASAIGILLCAQSGLITIDNSTTETAFL